VTDAEAELARHTYAAGPRHATQGLDRCLAAARAASRRFDHQGAVRFLDMARECAQASGRVVDFEEEDVVLRCHEAFVMGTGRLAAAELGLRALASRPEPSGRLVASVARACFYAPLEAGTREALGRDPAPASSQRLRAHADRASGRPPLRRPGSKDRV
jgi:hypothetical protein